MALNLILQRSARLATAGFFLVVPLWAYEPQNAEEAVRFGDQAFFFRDYGKAEKFYKDAVEESPSQALPMARLGLLHYAEGRYTLAREDFEKAAGLKKDSRLSDFLKNTLVKMEQNRAVLGSLEKAEGEGGDPLVCYALHQRAAAGMAAGKIYMGVLWPHLDFILKYNPSDLKILYALADGFYSSSDPRRAVHYYKKIAAITPANGVLLRRLADSCVNTGAYDDAGTYYRRALREACRDHQFKEIKSLKKMTRSLPNHTDNILSLLKDEEYDAAYKQLKKCLALNPQDPWAMTLLGVIYEEIGQGWQAERLYDKVVKNFAEYSAGHYYRGRYYLYKKKKYAQAVQILERFRETLDENRLWIENADRKKEQEQNMVRATRDIAYIYAEVLKQPGKALAVLEPFSVSHPKEAEIFYDIGCANLALKKRISAFQSFKKVIELSPGSELAKEAENALEFIQKSPDHGAYTGPYD